MEEISKKINELKGKIKKQEKKRGNEEKEIKKALGVFFKSETVTNFVENFYIKNKNLVIKTKNKTFASEVFLKRDKIKEALSINGVFIEKIVIH